MKENRIVIQMPNEKNLKCINCKYGNIINPFMTKCTKYKEEKPYDVYFKGADCPEFVPLEEKRED